MPDTKTTTLTTQGASKTKINRLPSLKKINREDGEHLGKQQAGSILNNKTAISR